MRSPQVRPALLEVFDDPATHHRAFGFGSTTTKAA